MHVLRKQKAIIKKARRIKINSKRENCEKKKFSIIFPQKKKILDIQRPKVLEVFCTFLKVGREESKFQTAKNKNWLFWIRKKRRPMKIVLSKES